MVKLTLDSSPRGATVIDLSTGTQLPGKTPMTTSLPGAKTPRQYEFRLHGYADVIVEMPLNHETFTYVETLQKGASAASPIVHKVGDVPLKAVRGLENGAAKVETGTTQDNPAAVRPDTSSPRSDTGSATPRPDTGPATGAATTKPDVPKPDTDDCPELPCIKKSPFGSNHQ
jgi:hypothetical protein